MHSLRFLAAAACAVALAPAAGQKQTALDRYVAAPDPVFKYELTAKIENNPINVFVLSMTSQSWRTAAEVDQPVWKHWLTVYRPTAPKTTTGFLFITGGNNRGGPPAKPDPRFRNMAEQTNSVVAELRMVPNQPITFNGDSFGPRTEDELIAYTWDKYLKTGDETWPARLPMTKAAVRAMDAVSGFLASEAGGKVRVDRYVVSGGSKRGWTAWTTAAVDKRITAVIPIVIDLLNVERSFRHHYQAYGFWAPAVKDYFNMGIMDYMGDPRYAALMRIEEPYEYRSRLTMPKFIVNSAGDQFFLPDSSQFYFDDLPGEKYLRYVPNSDHSLRGTDAFDSVAAFYDAVLRGAPRPKFHWKFDRKGRVRVTSTDGEPSSVKLWRATNSEARDFRLESVGPIYTSTDLTAIKPGVWEANVEKPEKGWTAFFVELTYPSGGKHPFKFTTDVEVIPDTLPYPPPVNGQTELGPRPASRGR